MGLTLRQLEKEKKELESLKIKIRNKHKPRGLHIAYFVQNGIFNKYLGNVLDRGKTMEETKLEIRDFFENIENNVVFISQYDNVDHKARQMVTKIDAHSPETFVISSIGRTRELCDEIKEKVMESMGGEYSVEHYEQELTGRRIYILNKIE